MFCIVFENSQLYASVYKTLINLILHILEIMYDEVMDFYFTKKMDFSLFYFSPEATVSPVFYLAVHSNWTAF